MKKVCYLQISVDYNMGYRLHRYSTSCRPRTAPIVSLTVTELLHRALEATHPGAKTQMCCLKYFFSARQ